jgi:hypothetical protein
METQETPVLDPQTPPPTDAPNGEDKAPEPTPEPEKKIEEEVSSKFAALAKKDKAISRRAQEIAAQEKAAKDLLAKAEAENKKFEAMRQKARENPIEAMKELGLTYEQVTEFILNKEKPTPDMAISQLREEIQELRRIREDEKKKAEEDTRTAQERQNQEVIANFQSSIGDFVQSNAADYELINFLDKKGLIDAKALIFRGIQMVHQDKGVVPTIKEGADGVQTYLLGEIESLIENVKYFKDKYSKPAPEPEKTPDGSIVTKTISNDMGSGMATSLPAMTEEQRIQRALAAMAEAEK